MGSPSISLAGAVERIASTVPDLQLASMRIQIAQIAPNLLAQRREEFLHDASLPLSVRGSINVHLMKPWIPNFWTVAIRAPKSGGDQSFFDFPIGYAEDGTSWFFPSRQWWLAHAKVSHSDDGMGCDPDVHTKFLSSEGDVHEFDYATILTDGTLKILGRADFAEECMFWTRAFGTR
jgi:hypothetical protein